MASATDVRTGGADEAVVEVATTVSPEVKIAAVQAVLSEDNMEVTEVLRDHIDETLALVQRLLASAGIQGTFSLPEAEGESVVVQIADATQERQLSPEAAERTLSTLQIRFDANSHLHEGCNWSRVKTALEADPEALWSINQMEVQGHMPDVYNFDDNGFDIGTCSEETPSGTRNCVYDAQAAAWLKENYPQETFNGSAVEMAEAMGIRLMSPNHYEVILQCKGEFDRQTSSWLLADKVTRESGEAPDGACLDGNVNVCLNDTEFHESHLGWRGELRVLWS